MEQRPGGQTTSAVARAGQLAISMAVTARARLEELAPKTGQGIQNLSCLAFAFLGGFLNL